MGAAIEVWNSCDIHYHLAPETQEKKICYLLTKSFIENLICYLFTSISLSLIWISTNRLIWLLKKMLTTNLDFNPGREWIALNRQGKQQRPESPIQVSVVVSLVSLAPLTPFVCELYTGGQTTGNIWAPKYYIFPINGLPHRPLLKKRREKSMKPPSKGLQRTRILAELKEKFPDFFSLTMQKMSEPLSSDACTRLKTHRDPRTQSTGCASKQ